MGACPLVSRQVKGERIQEQGIDITACSVVWSDENHDHVILGGPDRQHAVGAVQVPAADVDELIAGEPVAAGHTASVEHLLAGAASCRRTSTSKVAELVLGDGAQLDVDRRVRLRVGGSNSSSLALSSLVTRPARRSAKASSEPASASLSLSRRMTRARRWRSFACCRIRSSARLTSASDRTSMRTGVVPAIGSRTPASIQA